MQYRACIRSGLYRDHLKLTAPLLVLHVATDAARLGKMLDLTASQTPDTAAFHLFRRVDRFGPVYRPPDPMPELLDAPWARAGLDSLRIDLAKRSIAG